MAERHSIYDGNFAKRESVDINPDHITKKYRVYNYIFFTVFCCFVLLGFYFFHCYVYAGSENVLIIRKNEFSRPVMLLIIFELMPFFLVCLSGLSSYGFLIGFLVLALKGLLTGFSLYCYAFDGNGLTFGATLGVFIIYAVMYAAAHIFAASAAASMSRALKKGQCGFDHRAIPSPAKRYLFLIFPYILLFVVTLVMDFMKIGL